MVAPLAYQKGPLTPYCHATLELCRIVAAHVHCTDPWSKCELIESKFYVETQRKRYYPLPGRRSHWQWVQFLRFFLQCWTILMYVENRRIASPAIPDPLICLLSALSTTWTHRTGSFCNSDGIESFLSTLILKGACLIGKTRLGSWHNYFLYITPHCPKYASCKL